MAFTVASDARFTESVAAPPLRRSINAPTPTTARRGFDAADDLADGAARGHHVLDDEARLAERQREPAPEAHHAVLALGEERAHAERARDLVSDQDAADRGRQHRP